MRWALFAMMIVVVAGQECCLDTGCIEGAVCSTDLNIITSTCLDGTAAGICVPNGFSSSGCNVNGDCGSGQVCSPGPGKSTCVPVAVRSTCGQTSECNEGYVCSIGTNGKGSCVSGIPGTTVSCTEDADCPIAEQCTPGGVCIPTSVAICTLESGCPPAEVCSNNICVYDLNAGCIDNTQCPLGWFCDTSTNMCMS